MRVVLLGPPGAGKGTQGELLARRLGVGRYVSGDLLREAVREGSAAGRQAQGWIERGELVPDAIVTGIVTGALSRDAGPGFVLDGFPRTIAQAEALAEFLGSRRARIDAVVYLEVPESEVVKRLVSRRVCPSCGAAYNLHTNPPRKDEVCDRCGARLASRSDDDEGTVRRRLRVYEGETAPLVEWYRAQGVRLLRVNGLGSVAEVRARVRSALGL
ncbi:MAG: adenylate kinase [Gemmatimonadetes bacterium]|nr:adenylate kinase [Gemmatimonadota bacterium]